MPLKLLHCESAQITVKLRVAVAINRQGGAAVVGWSGGVDSEMREQAQLIMDDPRGSVRITELCLTLPHGSFKKLT